MKCINHSQLPRPQGYEVFSRQTYKVELEFVTKSVLFSNVLPPHNSAGHIFLYVFNSCLYFINIGDDSQISCIPIFSVIGTPRL